MNDSSQRAIPSVEAVLQFLGESELPRPVVADVVRRELAEIRAAAIIPSREEILHRIAHCLAETKAARLQPILNATGIPLHTNFGRAPIRPEWLATLTAMATGYSNLEYDLSGGRRGSRGAYIERCLALLAGAEAATIVNNCAAALVLIVRHLTSTKREVIISRGELIQIGGGFRIPEILESSGALLREVGTTNRTTLDDYARAIGPATGLILKVHRSNFFMDGFIASPDTQQLSRLTTAAGVPLVEDLGSGAVVDTAKIAGLEREPSPREVLRDGVDLVCFSGDKLFGGPQAGIIAGKGALVAALKQNPLFRALRCDKLILGALQATAEAYLDERIQDKPPVLALLELTSGDLEPRVKCLQEQLQNLPLSIEISSVEAEVGGGTLPRSRIPSVALSLAPRSGSVEVLAGRLRTGRPPVIGYIAHDRLMLDLRTIFPNQDHLLLQAIRQAVPAS